MAAKDPRIHDPAQLELPLIVPVTMADLVELQRRFNDMPIPTAPHVQLPTLEELRKRAGLG
jgi:hypothetical protein